MAQHPVWLDMDPGHDDALALLAALATLPVRGLSTVAGNQTVDKTFLNARRVLHAAGREIPVAPGYDRPLFRPLVTAGEIHGASGLEGYTFSPLEPVDAPHGLQLMADAFRESPEPIDIIATGPQTNVAAFLIGFPQWRSRIASVTFMGGSLNGGNVTPTAEFNIFVDPDAAHYVVQSGIPTRMVGLDVTHQALLHPGQLTRFLTLRPPLGEMLYGLFSFFGRHEPNAGADGMPIHDVLSVAALIHPEFFRWMKTPLGVERQDGERLGQTIPASSGPPIEVAVDIDTERFFAWLWQSLSAYQID
ncbi:nucleoside hydrolase [Sulfobacillus harzensis]|uniref:Nucleoside hydrolase n=1 Tax=Sulfobacillus harzensis TaxID=2729629 RepID=A0A7Y0L4G3_9FIRM|nr:nucleoside hydrolase [Sulfobacillus harzensis]NMP22777.1 nucleoside hydrolase [Sulfobacillus harzensis]